MALDPNKLRQALTGLQQQSPVMAGYAWAKAYADYARDAISIAGGSPLGVDLAQPLLGSTLAGIFSVSKDPFTTAQQMAAAFNAFWFLPPMIFSGASPGVVTAVPGVLALPLALTATWATNLAAKAPADEASQRIAQDLDAFTHSVVVAHTGPPPVVGPIT